MDSPVTGIKLSPPWDKAVQKKIAAQRQSAATSESCMRVFVRVWVSVLSQGAADIFQISI
jgi:hypothetical protein